MNELTTRLVLPPDVLLVPVRDLPASIYTLVDHQEGDYAITRLRARTPSRIVESRAAELLKQFIKPATILEAVLASSYLLRLDPEKTLEDAYPLILQLMNSSMLLPAGSAGAQEIQESFAVDQQISGFRVLRCLHCLEDTELYQVRHDRYGLAALKIARPGRARTMAPLLNREAAILSHLDGSQAPRLLHASAFRARPFIAMEWRPGAHITVVAEELRMESGKASWRALLDLCSALLDAYAQLHAAGVIHGDVHGSNILVQADHAVCLIDYGYSRCGKAKQWGEPPRAGIAHYYEPEYAQAPLERRPIPQASAASDQYALAALIYYCLSGSFYLEFSPEKEAMLRQIAEDEPLPLTSRGVRPCVNIGNVLRRALSKSPSGRFASVASFARAFRRAVQLDLAKKSVPATVTGGVEQVLLKAVLKRFAPESPLFVNKSLAAPTASVASGAAGIAYAFYRIACASENSRLLSAAELWASRARQCMDSDRAFYTDKLRPEMIGRVTPYHTASGIYCVEALLGHAAGDFARQESAMAGFLRRAAGECRNLDVTLGRSGTLLASCLLFEAARTHKSVDTKPLKNFADSAMTAIWKKAGSFDRTRRPSPAFDYLGIAHGWAGLLYATLRWCSCSGVSLPRQVEPSLWGLAACAERHGEGMRWPVLPADASGGYMSGWCHGSAGYVHLWTEAYRALGKTEFLALAESAARDTWEVRPQAGHICCGLAGQAYGLLALFQQTKDQVWLQRARKLARLAAGAAVTPEYASSLYKGDVGIAILAAEIATPDDACMPFFGREGWQ